MILANWMGYRVSYSSDSDSESEMCSKDPILPYTNRRTSKRVEASKRKARSELNNYGWTTLGYGQKFYLPDFKDTVERVDVKSLTKEEFHSRYDAPRVPCILTGVPDGWQANEKWTTARIARKYRNQKFKCGEDDSGYSVKMKMKYYIDYMKHTEDDSPLYIFDSGFGDRHKTKQLLEDYTVPEFFADDLFRYAEYKKRPPHRWIVMGPARSGTAIHIDPLGTSAWNTLIQGHKRWVLIPPEAPRALVKPYKTECGKHPDEAITWYKTVYNRVRSDAWPKEYAPIECRQGPGETMFVPAGWWHVVINEDDTIAVTQNFCSLANLHIVWPKTVKGRPKLSKHWYKRLKAERPEVIPLMDAALSSGAPTGDSSSSDSSSSSSSSDSDSDSDSGEDRMMGGRKRKMGSMMGGGEDCDTSQQCQNKMRRSPEK